MSEEKEVKQEQHVGGCVSHPMPVKKESEPPKDVPYYPGRCCK